MSTPTQPPGSGGPVSPAARPDVPAGAWHSAPRPPHAQGSARRKRRFGHLVSVRPTRDTLLTAAVAVGVLLVVKFVVAFVQLIGNAVAYSPTSYSSGFVNSPVGLFLGSLVLYPFFYYLAAFVALTVVFPVVRTAPLPTILGRAVAAGAVGTGVLAVVGIVTGISLAISSGDGVAVVLYVLFIPLAAGVQLTAVLAGGAVVAWLWLGHQSSEGAQEPAQTASGAEHSGAAEAPGAPVGAGAGAGALAGAGASAGVPGAAGGVRPVGVASALVPPATGSPIPLPVPDATLPSPSGADDLSRFAPPDERP